MDKEKCGQVAVLISDILDQGLEITSDVLFFAYSTYGMSEKDLQEALHDPEFEDTEIFLELIFHPDHNVRLALEPAVCSLKFQKEDESLIAREIFIRHKNVRLYFSGNVTGFRFDITESIIRRFVEKLYICRGRIDIVKALRKNLSRETAVSASVALRCIRREFSARVRQFLCGFIISAAGRKDIFLQLFELLLELLGRMPDNEIIEDYLLDQQKAMKKMLEDIAQFEKKKNQYSMEYLMMQKYPVPHESEELVAERLRRINIIINDILRIVPRAEPPVMQEDLGGFNPGADLQRLIRTLS